MPSCFRWSAAWEPGVASAARSLHSNPIASAQYLCHTYISHRNWRSSMYSLRRFFGTCVHI